MKMMTMRAVTNCVVPQLTIQVIDRARMVLLILLATILVGIHSPAKAEGYVVDCLRNGGNYYQFFNTTTIQVGNNAQVGDLLGTWINSSDPVAWNCTPVVFSYPNAVVQMSTQGYPPYTVWGSKNVDGSTYTVYNTTVKAGLGYVVRWRYTINGTTSAWQPLTIAQGGQQDSTTSVTTSNTNGSFTFGVDVQVLFVKTTTALTAGTTSAFDPIYVRWKQVSNTVVGTQVGSGTYMIADFQPGNLITLTGGTCTTPNVPVNLPEVGRNQFIGIGTSGGLTPFVLKFNNCSSGMNLVQYSFTPTTSVANAANGVVMLDSSSTATGVGMQLLLNPTTPVTFGTTYPLTSYNPAVSNGNYTLPLYAGLYQTGTGVTPGLVKSSITFTASYK
ncbi:type 1 fimbrial protein [Serratia sp. JSRIV001]|uniref:fimbrial protein n=1 Tax=Serratia sp. JSRIV001 TaxID=2831893 RepID=UPI001CC16A36|nr:fimbrial protein [Serratia sp. JSRIV001]UAN46428.1 type 1 fimbrial protein [Serratia sp. JSRIV001]